MAARVVIGIDGGGSLSRALLLDEGGHELARHEGGAALTDRPWSPIDIEAVEATVERAAAAARVDLPAAGLCAGLAGVGREAERRAVEAALRRRGMASVVRVVTDAEAAFFDAFGVGPGLLLIVGTGSMAWGRSEDGREARTGGWGALLGDDGSGYEIGLRALRASVRAADGRARETELLPRLSENLSLSEPEELIGWAADAGKAAIARLAPIVCELAGAGDRTSEEIMAAAIASLKAHVMSLLGKLGPWSAPPGLALVGGLVAPGGPLRDAVLAAAAECECAPLEKRVEPVLGAAHLALRDLGSDA
jgi:glucosamine kinase